MSYLVLVFCDKLPDDVNIEDIPFFYFPYLDNRVKAINDAITECEGEYEVFFWITDMHREPDLNTRKSPLLINYLASQTVIDKVLIVGDTSNSQILCENAISQLKKAIGSNRVYSITGNHEINDASRYKRPYKRAADVLRGHNTDIIYGDEDNTFFYFDDNALKTRYIGFFRFHMDYFVMNSGNSQVFLALVRLGINHSVCSIDKSIDWRFIQALAVKQGLSAVVIDGVGRLPTTNRPPKGLLLEWIGGVLQCYEYRYKEYSRTIVEMAGFYNRHGLKMMILKGYACSLDWPNPEHRPCGDIDIWLYGFQEEGDFLVEKEKGIKVDNSHHHHTVFIWNGFTVENHFDFINIHHHKSNVEFEKILKDLGKNDTCFIEIKGERVYIPSPNLHALFLLKHLTRHFAASEINLRQLLDWAFFVEKHGVDVDWEWLERISEQYGMKELYGIFNAICVEDLGFDSSIFHSVLLNPELKTKVLNDILSPVFYGSMPSGTVKRIIYKFQRWKSNEWKHKLCYNESMWSAFWSGVWSHLIKPKTI